MAAPPGPAEQDDGLLTCPHLAELNFSQKVQKLILKPLSWQCHVCGTTDGVWACLECGEIGCGRFAAQHSLKHYQRSKHPVALEINSLLCHCYECDGWVHNEPPWLSRLRKEFASVSGQEPQHDLRSAMAPRVHRNLRSRPLILADDKLFTAQQHYRRRMLRKALAFWRHFVAVERGHVQLNTSTEDDQSHAEVARIEDDDLLDEHLDAVFAQASREREDAAALVRGDTMVMPGANPTASPMSTASTSGPVVPPLAPRLQRRQSTIFLSPQPGSSQKECIQLTTPRDMVTPGQTGLRNLGNTCFMNAVLQSLSSTVPFRTLFLDSFDSGADLVSRQNDSAHTSPPPSQSMLPPTLKRKDISPAPINLQSTLTTTNHNSSNSASTSTTDGTATPRLSNAVRVDMRPRLVRTTTVECFDLLSRRPKKTAHSALTPLNLCLEMRNLMRVLWSRNHTWAVISPCSLFAAVWEFQGFRGYKQQDAHELLRYLLDRLHTEMVLEAQAVQAKMAGGGATPRTPNVAALMSPRGPLSPVSPSQAGKRELRSTHSHGKMLGGSGGPTQPGTTASPAKPAVASPLKQTETSAKKAKLDNGTVAGAATTAAAAELVSPNAQSAITELFGGLLRSEVVCGKCGHTSVSREPFLDVSLDIPQDKMAAWEALSSMGQQRARRAARSIEEQNAQSNGAASGSAVLPARKQRRVERASSTEEVDITSAMASIPSLNDCFDLYTKPEPLGQTGYCCEKCRSSADVTKRASFDRLPIVLCLHMKRFKWHRKGTKVETHVRFPLTGLDISKYCGPFIGNSAAKALYDLSAVVVHEGSGALAGHYTAYVRNDMQRTWLHCSDKEVTIAAESDVLDADGYIFFYTRRGAGN